MLKLRNAAFPLVLSLFFVLVSSVPVRADGADWIEDRFQHFIQTMGEGSLEELATSVEPEERFTTLSLRGRIELLTVATSVVDMVSLGEKSPLRGRISPQQWDFLVRWMPRIKQAAAAMHRSLYQSTFEALSGGELGPSRALVGSANLALRDIPHNDKLAWALRVFTATRLTTLGCEPSLLGILLERSARADLDPEQRDAAMHLYVLHGSTKAAAEVQKARLLAAL